MEDIEKVYLKYAIPLKKYVMTLCKNVDLADDVVADTFYKAIKHIDQYDEKTQMYTWLCSIAKHTYIDLIRKTETNSLPITEVLENTLTDSRTDVSSDLETKETKLQLYKCIQALEGNTKDVLYLRIFPELSFEEIGNILGKSENWARVTY